MDTVADTVNTGAQSVCITLHGVFMEVCGMGVLMTGAPAIGKSELALELISRGHRLVADDAVEVRVADAQTVEGLCPEMLRDMMEVRGLGIINVRRLFGETAVKYRKNLKLIIDLIPAEACAEVDRFHMRASRVDILGVAVPKICLPVAVGRNLAVLVEVAARNHILRDRGYEAAIELAERQRQAMQ